MSLYLNENYEDWRLGHATNPTDTSFATKAPKSTEPTGDGVHRVGLGGCTKQRILLVPFGVGDADQTFSVRVIGWKKLPAAAGNKLDLWIPVVLAELACTLGSTTGAANTNVPATSKFCDTVAIVANMGNGDMVDIQSPVQELTANVRILLQSFELIEFSYDMTGATSGNVVFCLY